VCNLYSMTTNVEAIRRMFQVEPGNDDAGNLAAMPGIFPDYRAPIVRSGGGGRELTMARWGILPTIGTANGILAVKLIGVDTGVELFLLPCVLLGAILFRSGERPIMLAVTAFPFAAYLFLDGIVGAPLAEYSAGEYRSIISMHAFSVASLLALIGFAFPSNTEGT
jgi:hypothetical protein